MPIRTNLDGNLPATEMEYRLPSRGLPYLERHQEFPETIKISPYSIETEGYMLGNSTTHDKMAFVTSKVAKLPSGFDVGELVMGDEFFILAVARALTYGETYSFRAQCPNCSFIETINLKVPAGLPIHSWDREKPPAMEVRLPVCKDLVTFKMLTVREDGAASKYVREMVARGGATGAVSESNLGYMRRMAHHIKSVNQGTPDNITEADQYVNKLKGPDMVAFTDALDEHSCGIHYDWWITCDKCQFVYERNIPIVGDFFRRNQSYRRPNADSVAETAPLEPPPNDFPAEHAEPRI